MPRANPCLAHFIHSVTLKPKWRVEIILSVVVYFRYCDFGFCHLRTFILKMQNISMLLYEDAVVCRRMSVRSPRASRSHCRVVRNTASQSMLRMLAEVLSHARSGQLLAGQIYSFIATNLCSARQYSNQNWD